MLKTRMMRWLGLGLIALLSATGAHAAIIDFDGLANNTFVDNQFAGDGILFDSVGGGVRVFSYGGAHTPTNTIGGTDAGGALDFNQLITLTFVDPTDSSIKATTDFISVFFTDLQLTGNSLTAYDINGIQIGQVFAPCPGGDFTCNLIEEVTLSLPGIHQVVLDGAGGRGQADVAFDTISFNPVQVAAVSEPAHVALLGLGLALLGFTAGRRGKL